MSFRRFVAPLLVALAFMVPAAGQAAPTIVGTDDAGDYGMGDQDLDPVLAQIGAALGQDLLSAGIEVEGDTVNFVIGVTGLPEAGGTPEASRYTWDMLVDGVVRQLDGKFTNYSRGACDPTAGTCPPPRDPGMAPFAVRGNCSVSGTVTTCQELGLVHATFDPATDTITIPVPAALLGGCLIDPSPNVLATGGEALVATPSAFVSSAAAPMDRLAIETTVSIC